MISSAILTFWKCRGGLNLIHNQRLCSLPRLEGWGGGIHPSPYLTPRFKSSLIRAGTIFTVYEFGRTVQSDYLV